MGKTIGIQKKPQVDEAELDKLAKEEEIKTVIPPEDPEKESEEEEGKEDKEEEIVEEEIKKVEIPEKKSEVDYKEKFKESSKEAMVLRKQLDEINAEKAKVVEITDEFLKQKYPEWDELTTGEQKALRKAEELEQKINIINNKTNEFDNDRKWVEKVNEYIEEDALDEFPQLKGREEKFKKFATLPTRKGLPLDDLVKIFLFENPEEVKQKRTLFNAPGGEGKGITKSEEYTPEEIAKLRQTDNRKYMQLIKEKKIKIDF